MCSVHDEDVDLDASPKLCHALNSSNIGNRFVMLLNFKSLIHVIVYMMRILVTVTLH